jgi:glycosyltransferase involved in cell wall biosynthesis
MNGPRVAHVTTIDLTLRKLVLKQLIYLKEQGFDVTGISAPGPSVEVLEAHGIRHIPWGSATRSWNLRGDLRAARELHSIFKRERFDVVHTHNPKPGIIGRIAARMAGVPAVVNTVHGFYAVPEDRFSKRVAVMGLEYAAAKCSHLELYQSDEDLRWARKLHLVPERKAAWLGNGTDLSLFDATGTAAARAAVRRDLGFSPDDIVVGTVGRLVLEKGYREFFAAARSLRGLGIRFLVVGDADPAKSDAVTQAELDAASGDVTFAGWRDDMPDVMSAMDVFVLASYREGLPRSAVEASALGKPLVLTDIRGCREVVEDGIQGFLVPARDAAALSRSIARLTSDAELRRRMGAAAALRARTIWDENRVARTVHEQYVRLLGLTAIENDILIDLTDEPATVGAGA